MLAAGRKHMPVYWAVKFGFEGPKIYSSWEEGARPNVEGYPGAWFRSFRTLVLARTWLDETDPSLVQAPYASTFASRTPASFRPAKRPHSDSFDDPPTYRAGKHESRTKRSTTPTPETADSPEIPDTPLSARSSELPPAPTTRTKAIAVDPAPVPVPPREPEVKVKTEESLIEPDISDEVVPSSPERPRASQSLAPPPSTEITLSPEQEYILNMVLGGESLFFTGSAGTGKSVLLREIIRRLRDDPTRKVAVTASTGIAAVNIGGSTLHSFAGCGLAKESAEVLGKKVKGTSAVRRWRQTTTLIVDEISMIDGTLFDKLEYVARVARISDKPFGGLQLVLCGDFYQLPPVPDQHDGLNLPILFTFEADSWKRCVPRILTLTRVFRQKDQEFINILNNMRLGNLNEAAVARFRQLEREVVYADGVLPTELYSTRKEVDNANFARLKVLPLPEKKFIARDFPGYNTWGKKLSQKEATKLLESLVAPQVLTLRVGAQVMLIQNLIQGILVNGTLGRVTHFMTIQQANEARLEIARLERSNSGPSRGPQLQTSVPPTGDGTQWPVVEFENGRKALCPPSLFSVTNVFGQEEASRDQVPLIVAWAMSIHKSQGQTLGRVKIDMGRIFEKGQAYVAISRATSLESLQILNFQPAKVQAHIRVIEFSKTLLKSGVIPLESENTAMAQPTDTYVEDSHADDEFQDSVSEEWMSA